MSAKKTTKKKIPGRGGKRAGAGAKPQPDAKRFVLSVRVTGEAKARIIAAAKTRGMTAGEVIQEWSRMLWVP